MSNLETQAVVISFDLNYKSYAHFLVRQIDLFTPKDIEIYMITPDDVFADDIIEEFAVLSRKVTHIPFNYDKYRVALVEVSHLTISMYARLFIPEVLPDSVVQSLYIDIDVLILDSIEEIFSLKLEKTLGAVGAGSKFPHLSVDIPAEDTFYAGLLIINHKQWKSKQILKKCLDLASQGIENLVYPDNDLLVMVLNEDETPDWQPIPIEYNYMNYLERESRTKVSNPHIIHFPGKDKPWNSPFGGRYAREWRRRFKVQTPDFSISWKMYRATFIQITKDKVYKFIVKPVLTIKKPSSTKQESPLAK